VERAARRTVNSVASFRPVSNDRRKSRRVLLWSAVAFVVVVAVLTARLFVWPPTDSLHKADAILVMSGSGPRDQKGLALARAGYAPLLLVSNGFDSDGIPRSDSKLCGSHYYGVRVVCFLPRPYTTQGEARYLARTAVADHLHTVIVVAGRAQTVRARLRVTRCFNGQVVVDPVSPTSFARGVYLVLYEWGALLKALVLQRGC
jgi:hypothetical protein